MKILRAVLFLSLVCSAVARADFYISPQAEYFNADQNRHFESSVYYGLAVGYMINPQVSLELAGLRGHSDQDNGGADVDGNRFRLDAIYDFYADDFSPYLIAGVGRNDFDLKNASNEANNFVTMGVGIKYNLTEAVSFKTEARAYHNVDGRSDTESGVTAGFDYIFQSAR